MNLGFNRWAFKPEVGVSHQIGRWTLDGYAGVWYFTMNDEYYPGRAVRRQDPIIAWQTHVTYALPHRAWLSFNGTWFSGGQTRIERVPSRDLQRNSRLGATLSIPISSRQSLKFVDSTRRNDPAGIGLQHVQRDVAARHLLTSEQTFPRQTPSKAVVTQNIWVI